MLPKWPEEWGCLQEALQGRENAIIEQIMDMILQSGPSSHQPKALLERTITLVEWGDKAATKTTH